MVVLPEVREFMCVANPQLNQIKFKKNLLEEKGNPPPAYFLCVLYDVRL